jgi:DNA repair exonuclease SbcCD ATPase subunit
MKITDVIITDFLAIGRAGFTLDGQGLVLVQGENHDNPAASSNGAGKSSLVDAICWALYGETARGADGVSAIRAGAKEARVALTLEDEDSGAVYVVTRSRSKSKTLLELVAATPGAATVNLTQGTVALTQAKLTAILGAGVEVFRAAVYLGQEGMPDLPAMTDKRLKELIEEAAGLSAIEACYDRARVIQQNEEGLLARAKIALGGLVDQIQRSGQNLRFLVEQEKIWRAERQTRHDATKAQLHAAHLTVQELEAALLPGTLLAQQAETALATAQAELAGFDGLRLAARQAAAARVAAEREVTLAETRARQAIETLKIREAHLHHIQTGHPCESCGQALQGVTLTEAVRGAADAVREAQERAREAARDVQGARGRVAASRTAAEAAEAAIPDVTALQGQIQAHQAELERIATLRRELATAQGLVATQSAQLRAIEGQTSPHAAGLAREQTALQALREERLEADKAITVHEQAVEQARAVVSVFGPSGVRAEILDQVTPYLNARTAAYLDALSDGTLKAVWTTLVRDAKGNLREKFCIEVTHPAGEGFAALSGGEKRKVRIATALALQDLVASRASKPLRLWIADEIDDALDAAGLERLMGVLGEKAREKGTVLVISHNALTDWISNVWTVAKRGGVAALETC